MAAQSPPKDGEFVSGGTPLGGRTSLLLGFLLSCIDRLGQLSPADSQTLQALLAEVAKCGKSMRTNARPSSEHRFFSFAFKHGKSRHTLVAALDDARARLTERRLARKNWKAKLSESRTTWSTPTSVERKSLEDMVRY